MKLRLALIAGLILLLASSVLAQGEKEKAKKGITFYSYEEGQKKARQDSRQLAAFFETTWCKFCKIMEKNTLTDPRIIELLNTKFVAVKVDGDKRRDLANDFKVRGYPETWFIKSDGSRIAPAPGYWPPEEFYWLLRYISDHAYEKEQFKDFVERMKKQKG